MSAASSLLSNLPRRAVNSKPLGITHFKEHPFTPLQFLQRSQKLDLVPFMSAASWLPSNLPQRTVNSRSLGIEHLEQHPLPPLKFLQQWNKLDLMPFIGAANWRKSNLPYRTSQNIHFQHWNSCFGEKEIVLGDDSPKNSLSFRRFVFDLHHRTVFTHRTKK